MKAEQQNRIASALLLSDGLYIFTRVFMKWILTDFKLPDDGQCCHVVFDHDDPGDTVVWWAQYKDGKWFGVDLPGNDTQELGGKAICWMPEPENPFAKYQDV